MFLTSLSIPWKTVDVVAEIWLWIRLFRFFQMWKTKAWVTSLRKSMTLFLLGDHSQESSSDHSINKTARLLNLCIIILHIFCVSSHDRNRWSRVSSPREHTQHVRATWMRHAVKALTCFLLVICPDFTYNFCFHRNMACDLEKLILLEKFDVFTN